MKWVTTLGLVLLISIVSSEVVPRVRLASTEECVTVEGGRDRMLCVASIVGAGVSLLTGNVGGALVSGFGVGRFC
jgi:hypothetical protein